MICDRVERVLNKAHIDGLFFLFLSVDAEVEEDFLLFFLPHVHSCASMRANVQ